MVNFKKNEQARALVLVVSDQVAFSAAGILFQVLAVRYLGMQGFGVFSVVYALVPLLLAVQNALFLEPATVIQGKMAEDERASYLATLARLNIVLSVLLAVICGSMVVVFVDEADVFIGCSFVVCFACISAFTMKRRSKMILGRMVELSARSLIYLMLIAGLLAGLGISSVGWLFLLISLCAFLCTLDVPRKNNAAVHSARFSEHRGYGAWMVLSALFSWLPLNIPIYLIAQQGTVEDVGTFKSTLNLIVPCMIIIGAVGNLIVSRGSAEYARGDYGQLLRFLLVFALFGGGVSLTFSLTIFFFMNELFLLVYGGNVEYAHRLVSGVWLLPLASFFAAIAGVLLRILNRPALITFSYAISSAVLLLLFAVSDNPVDSVWDSVNISFLVLAFSQTLFLLYLYLNSRKRGLV